MSLRRRFFQLTWFAAVALASGPQSLQGIEIDVTIDNPQNFPSYDADGSKLAAISAAAAAIWERLRPGDEQYDWNIHWEDFDDGEHLAVANSFDGSIRVKTDADWFLDATPLDNSEYEPFTAFTAGELDQAQVDAWFPDSSPPDDLEYGYFALPKADEGAEDKHDLLSILLHEMGHLSGISKNIFSPDVPIPSQWVGAHDVKVKREDEGHIIPDQSLMDPNDEIGRTLPSALDVMVNANEKGASSVHLDRIYFIGNLLTPDKFWGNPLNWLGGRVPDAKQTALLRGGDSILVISLAEARSVAVGDISQGNDGTQLVIASQLDVANDLTVFTQVLVGPAGELIVNDRLQIDGVASGELIISPGGTIHAQRLAITGGGSLSGSGSVVVEASLSNDWNIAADGGFLNFVSVPGVQYDLDGPNDLGRLAAESGDIRLGPGTYADFHGDMQIKEGHFVELDDHLTFAEGAELRFDNGPTPGAIAEIRKGPHPTDLEFRDATLNVAGNTGATLHADSVLFAGDQVVQVDAGGILTLAASTEFESTSKRRLGNNATLHLAQQTTFQGGSVESIAGISSNSMLRTSASLNVIEDTLITVGYFDWDGAPSMPSITQIKPLKRFTIRAGKIGSPFSRVGDNHEGFGDTIDLNSGQLDVLVGSDVPGGLDLPAAWRLNPGGTLNLNHVATFLPTVKGSLLTNKGTISGQGRFDNALANEGLIQVGHTDAIGYIELAGTFEQSASGEIEFELGGLIAGTDYDQLKSSNAVTLEGTARVKLLPDYHPLPGDTFRVIDAMDTGSLSGDFDQVLFPLGVWEVIYGPDYVDVRLAGLDPDADYDVDSNDLLVLLANWTGAEYAGQPKTWQNGDEDGDGDIDSSDLLALIGQWTGAQAERQIGSAGAGVDPERAIAVPEPAGGLLALFGVLTLPRRRRRCLSEQK